MNEALVDDHHRWLTLLTNELEPDVVASHHLIEVTYQPWVDPHVSCVELCTDLLGLPDNGSAFTALAYADQEALPAEEGAGFVYRLGTLFGAALREWVDPH